MHYHLPTFYKDVDTRCFPLSYNLTRVEPGLEPDPSVSCDSPVCRITSLQDIQILACFHTFHMACLPADGCCPLCDGPLRKIAKDLSESFNKGLLKNSVGEEDEEEDLIPDDDNTADQEIPSTDEAEEYYTSPEWERKMSEQIETFANISHPHKPNRQSHSQPSHITTQPTHHSAPNTQSRQSATEEAHRNTQTSNLPTLNLFIPCTRSLQLGTSLDHYLNPPLGDVMAATDVPSSHFLSQNCFILLHLILLTQCNLLTKL